MTTLHSSRDLEAQGEAQKWFTNWATVIDRNVESRKNAEDGAWFGDSSDKYWKLYGSEAETGDRKFAEALNNDMTVTLVVNILFSSIIATFIVATYQTLQPDNSQQTVCLLSQLVSQGNSSQESSPFCPGPYPGVPPTAALRSNILLYISFFLTMTTVLGCVFIQHWCREFMQYAYPVAAPHLRGRVRTYLYRGLHEFHIRVLIYVVHLTLQLSVFVFFCGVSDYLHLIYPRVGMTSWSCTIALATMYMAFSISPLVIRNSPYKTALSRPLDFGGKLLLFLARIVWWYLRCGSKETFPKREDLQLSKKEFLMDKANARVENLDPYAIKWLFTDNDFSATDMDEFLEGFPGYIHSHLTAANALPKVLTSSHILLRFREHLLTCVTDTELPEQARLKRVSLCVDSLGALLQHPGRTSAEDPDKEPLRCIQGIVDNLNGLCERSDKIVSLRAFCVRALAFQGLLTGCLEPAKEGPPNNKFPGHFIPLYTFFSSWDNTSRRDTVSPPTGDFDESKMWQTVLNDGPLINLTLLARTILSRDDADRSGLSLCWKTFDILRSQLRINRVDVSDYLLVLFNEEHKRARQRVGDEESDFGVVPLLEALDAVTGGRRLSLVFRDFPKYHSKADLVFGKDRLRNPDLLRAVADCLPEFVTNHPEKSVEVMKGLVCYDHLWTSLQANLLVSLQSNSSIPDKLRVFDRCCTVIDTAFASLENSEDVNWRAPDFGSLAHYFELFATDCFQGMFIERAIGFRIGLIKARFCKAILTQFLVEFHHTGTVVFRSQWDVASLARVSYSLGVGNAADVEFWKSFVDGGPIGVEFMARTHATLETAARDGPLLNFYKLGHLGMMAVPFKGSGLEDKGYFKKLLDLLQKMTEDPRLPLTLASTRVWEYLGQLRDEVFDIFARSTNEDKANIQDLLAKIDAVYKLHPSSTQEHNPSNHVQSQASGTSAVVQPSPPPRGPTSANDISSYVSTSTAVGGSHFQGDDSGGIIPAPINHSSRAFPNLYYNPYPFLPSQIGPGGVTAHTFSASFLPILSPPPGLGSTDLAPPGIPSVQHPSPYMRYNGQDGRAPVYYPPSGNP